MTRPARPASEPAPARAVWWRRAVRRLLRMLRPPRRFPPTREGWWFLGATLLVGLAAINGGINLLFLVFGMMLSLILASGVLSEICLRHLAVTRRMPGAIHAGTPFLMGIAVRNDKKRVPTFSLEVEDLLEGQPVERRCYYLKLPAGRMQETAYKHSLARRGRHRFTGFRISTRFPFGFIRKSRDVESPAEVLVYPALVPVPEALIRGGIAEAARQQVATMSRSGDFHGLREFRSGDDPRDIHWRTSARRGRPFVRELEEETGRIAMVVLDDHPLAGATEAQAARAFEEAVSMAASLAVALLKKGLAVGLRTAEATLPPGAGVAHTAAILSSLALVQPGSGASGEGRPPAPPGTTLLRVRPALPAPSVEVETPAADRRSA
jgi:uncharacterized protein (DUF58 family)